MFGTTTTINTIVIIVIMIVTLMSELGLLSDGTPDVSRSSGTMDNSNGRVSFVKGFVATTTTTTTRTRSSRSSSTPRHGTSFLSSLSSSIPSSPSSSFTSTTLSSTSTKSSTTSASTSTSTSPWKDFDYNNRWYPVIWACDLVPNEPTKVTLFDVDFVIAKTTTKTGKKETDEIVESVIAMEDICPHKAAALSEGRVTTSGHIQCAYHGWTFDGKSGTCVDIPQVARRTASKTSSTSTPSSSFPVRSCARAVPALIHQGMTYIFWGSAEPALIAPSPPTVEEYDDDSSSNNNKDNNKPSFKVSSSVRDMPVDWPIVVSNICDADHGLFAHQSTAFDMYAASVDYPMDVTQEFPHDGTSWTMSTKVDSTMKLIDIDKSRRQQQQQKRQRTKGNNDDDHSNNDHSTKGGPSWATTKFVAPFHLQMKRIDKDTGQTNFVTTFYICPVGVGRCRFMGGAVGKAAAPRWIVKLALDNFLDQDTYLLATQQHHILPQEANDIRDMLQDATGSTMDEKIQSIQSEPMSTRRKLFCLSSPTDALGAKLERFWDATLLRSPNRISNLLKLDEAGYFLQTPPRSVVLDRKKQVLDVSPEHQAVVKNCKTIRRIAVMTSLITLTVRILAETTTIMAMNRSLVTRMKSILNPAVLVGILGLSTAIATITGKIIREYFFKYTEEYRRKDMNKIPKSIWQDV